MKIKQLPFLPMNDVHNKEVEILETLLNSIKEQTDVKENFNLFFDDVKAHFFSNS